MDKEKIKRNLLKSDDLINNRHLKKKYSKRVVKSKIFSSSFSTKSEILDDPDGMKVLFWRAKGLSKRVTKMEINLARYFMSKGMKTEFVICDGSLTGCIAHNVFLDNSETKNIERWHTQCPECYHTGRTFLHKNKMSCHGMKEWISFDERLKYKCFADEIRISDIETYAVDGIPVGDIAITGVSRYFRSLHSGRNIEETENNAYLECVVREYFYSSLVSSHVAQRSIDDMKPDRLIMIRGVYPLWGPAVYAAVLRDIPVLYWGYGYEKESVFMRFVIKEDFEQIHSPQKTYWSTIKDKKLTEKEDLRLDIYMTNRINKLSQGRISYGDTFPSVEQLKEILNIQPEKKIWMINSHCNWDWDIYIENKIFFRDPVEWFIKTFEIAMDNTSVEWIIRTHPAENNKNTKLLCKDIILQKFKTIPSHIKIITSDSDINSYSMFPLVDGCITMQSTVGFEMALFGKPVILGDYGFYGDKGFTHDPKTLQEYTDLLNNIESIGPLSQDEIDTAKRYVYDFLFYRQIPLRDSKYRNTVVGNPLYRMIYKRLIDLDQVGWDPPPLGEIENNGQYDWRKRLIEGWKK